MQAAILSAGRQGNTSQSRGSVLLKHCGMYLQMAPTIERSGEDISIGKTAANITMGVTAHPSLAR